MNSNENEDKKAPKLSKAQEEYYRIQTEDEVANSGRHYKQNENAGIQHSNLGGMEV